MKNQDGKHVKNDIETIKQTKMVSKKFWIFLAIFEKIFPELKNGYILLKKYLQASRKKREKKLWGNELIKISIWRRDFKFLIMEPKKENFHLYSCSQRKS